MAKTKKPKKEDYLKDSKGQELGTLVNQGARTVTNTNQTRTITGTNG